MLRSMPESAAETLTLAFVEAAAQRAARRGQRTVYLPRNLKALLQRALMPPTIHAPVLVVTTDYGKVQLQ